MFFSFLFQVTAHRKMKQIEESEIRTRGSDAELKGVKNCVVCMWIPGWMQVRDCEPLNLQALERRTQDLIAIWYIYTLRWISEIWGFIGSLIKTLFFWSVYARKDFLSYDSMDSGGGMKRILQESKEEEGKKKC